MTIKDKVKFHFENRTKVRLTRQISDDHSKTIYGYIVDYSSKYLILQETDNFQLLGYVVLPLSQLSEIRNNHHDKYYHKIMQWEKETEKISLPYQIDLSTWQTIFRSIKKIGLNVIVECEDPEIDSFTIGPISKITKNLVYITYFNASGYLDEKPTSIDYESITKLTFDDRYINIFSKYLRSKKRK